MKNVLAMILAGGRVDELDVLTFLRPKSVLPFGALYRIIDFPMSNLMHSGIERVGILSQYRPFYLINHIASGQPWDMIGRRRFAVILPPFKGREASDWYKGTADAVYQNIDFIKMYNPDLVLILSGDHIYQMDYQDVINFHLEKKADLTIAFTSVPREGAHRFGQGLIEEEEARGGKVVQYAEKPKKALYEWASLTIYVFNPGVLLEALAENARKESHEFGKDIIPSLLGNFRVYGYKHLGYWVWGVGRRVEAQAFEAGRGDVNGGAQLAQFDGDVGHHDIHEVDAAVQPAWRRRPRRHRRCRASPPGFRDRSRAGTGRWRWCGTVPSSAWGPRSAAQRPGTRESHAPSGGRAGIRARRAAPSMCR